MTKSVLVDTSVWIEFFNGVKSKESDLLSKYIKLSYPIFLCPVILQEILQGFRSDNDYEKCKELLLEFPFIHVNTIDMAIGAADIYRTLRKRGITIRKSNDCLIAFYALSHKIPILFKDRDFSMIHKHIPGVKIIKV